MKKLTVLYVGTGLLVLVGGIAWLIGEFAGVAPMTPGPNSPIKIVGGSIEFSTGKSGWAPSSSPATSIASKDKVDTTQVAVVDLDGTVPNFSLSGAWEIVLTDNDTNYPHTITICPSTDMSTCGTAAQTTYVLAKIGGAAGPFFSCDVYNPSGTCDGVKYFRYFDPPATTSAPSFLEYITQIQVGGTTYTCLTGHCNVYIGKGS
jgi:hypothetical protein